MTRSEPRQGCGPLQRWSSLAVLAGYGWSAFVCGQPATADEQPGAPEPPQVIAEHEAVEILPPPSEPLSVEELAARLRSLETEHAALLDRLDESDADSPVGRAIRQTQFQPRLDERSGSLSDVGASNTDQLPSRRDNYGVGYDTGFYIRPDDPQRDPYEMVINGRMQFRYVGFARERDFWIDSAGNILPINNKSFFEVERGWLSFRGFMLAEQFQYFVNLDYDTDDANQVVMMDFWVNWEFSEAFNVFVGQAFVPGSRDWLNGSLTTRFADRSLATTFFRPDRTWVSGLRANPGNAVTIA